MGKVAVGPNHTAAFRHRLTEKHDVSDAEFLVNAAEYLTALARQVLCEHLNYSERNHIENWFQTVTLRIDVLTRSDVAVQPAPGADRDGSDTSIITTRRSAGALPLRRYSNGSASNTIYSYILTNE